MRSPLPDIERAFGKIAIMQDEIAALVIEVKTLREGREHDAQRIQFLTNQVDRLNQLPEFYTEQETAELLRVHVMTLKRWRAAKQIPFVQYSGGDVRYRRADIESFLKDCERKRKAA